MPSLRVMYTQSRPCHLQKPTSLDFACVYQEKKIHASFKLMYIFYWLVHKYMYIGIFSSFNTAYVRTYTLCHGTALMLVHILLWCNTYWRICVLHCMLVVKGCARILYIHSLRLYGLTFCVCVCVGAWWHSFYPKYRRRGGGESTSISSLYIQPTDSLYTLWSLKWKAGRYYIEHVVDGP